MRLENGIDKVLLLDLTYNIWVVMFYRNQCTYFKQRLCQCGSGLILTSCHKWVEFNCRWFSLCSEGFLRVLRFSSFHKNQHFNFHRIGGSLWEPWTYGGPAWKPTNADASSSLTDCNLRYFFPVGLNECNLHFQLSFPSSKKSVPISAQNFQSGFLNPIEGICCLPRRRLHLLIKKITEILCFESRSKAPRKYWKKHLKHI